MASNRKIDSLLPLQEIDLAVHRLKTQRAELPRRLAGAEEKVARAKANVEAIHAEIKDLKLQSHQRELSVKEMDERILKLVTQANQARKNDEYQVLLKGVSAVKAEKGRVEEGLLDLLYQADEKAKLERLRQEDLRSAQDTLSVEQKRVERETAELDAQIAAVEEKRNGLAAGVDADILTPYERILAAKGDGLAIAPVSSYAVIEDTGRVTYYQCDGCSVGITSHDLNLLLLGKDVQVCRNCSRILYVRAREE